MRQKDALMDEFYDEFEFETEILDFLKETREKQGLSLQEFADKVGIHKSTLIRFEAGRANPTLSFLKKIIIGLGLKITLSKNQVYVYPPNLIIRDR
jgi:transcriptional regulator with XRE-family HTH domain